MASVDEVEARTLAREGAPGDQASFARLVRTVWRLRQPDGCPWDRVQTHGSICKNMIEEAYEAVDALEAGDRAHTIEELGDVLLQVLLHVQIAADEGDFTMDDVCDALNEKLVRRHPHVFGEVTADGAAAALVTWEGVKDAERGEELGTVDASEVAAHVMDSVPVSLPALAGAQKLAKRMLREGVTDAGSVVEGSVSEREAGDALFLQAARLYEAGVDAEEALRHANGRVRAAWPGVVEGRGEELARGDIGIEDVLGL